MMISRRGQWLQTKVDGETLMMSVGTGHYIGMSRVGSRIWDLIEQPLDLDSLCAALELEFDVTPELCRAEVVAFLDDLAGQQVVAITPAPVG